MDINAKIKLIAETMSGYTVLVDSSNGANVELSKITMPCILVFIQETGEFASNNSHYRDSVNIRVAFLNKMPKGFKESDVEAMRYALKQDMVILYHKLKFDFQFKINNETVRYEIVYDEFDDNLIGVIFNDNIKERVGLNLACDVPDSHGELPSSPSFCQKVSECSSIVSINELIEGLQYQIDNLPTTTPTLQQVITESNVVDGDFIQSNDGGTFMSIGDEYAQTYSENSIGDKSSVRQQSPLQISDFVTDSVNSVYTKTNMNGFIVDDYNVTASTPTMFNSSKGLKSLTASVWGTFIVALTSKTTPANADSIEISDSAASGAAKKVSLTNFKAFLKTYFDTLYTTTSAVATQITTALSGYLTSATAASTYKTLQVIASATTQTSLNDVDYIVNASTTFTDPTPVEAKGFSVIVRNGTATVGGVAYATAGTTIKRIFHSGAWSNYVYYKCKNTNTLQCLFTSINLGDAFIYYFATLVNTPATISANARRFRIPFNGLITKLYFTSASSTPTSSQPCVLSIKNVTTGTTTIVGDVYFDNISNNISFTGLTIAGNENDEFECLLQTPVLTTNGAGSQCTVQLYLEEN